MHKRPFSPRPRLARLYLALALAASCSAPTLDVGRDDPDASREGGVAACEGRTLCEGSGRGSVCVDTALDPANCGGCGRVCASGVCVAGACCEGARPALCAVGRAAVCADTSSDPSHCGGCGRVCASGACFDGVCCPGERAALVCATPDGPACVDPATDVAHCGACGAMCASGACIEGDCCEGEGFAACEVGGARRCLDVRADPANCGGCGVACEDGCAAGRCCTASCGAFCAPSRVLTRSAPGGREAMAPLLEDLDADGFDDFVVPTQLSNEIWIFWGNREGAMLVPTRIASGRVSPHMGIGDVDGDGFLDLAALVQSRGPPFIDQIRIFYVRAGRRIDPGPVLRHPENPPAVQVARVDADEHADLLIRLPALGCIGLRLGNGRGHFEPARCIIEDDIGASFPQMVVLGEGAGPVTIVERRVAEPAVLRWRHLDADGNLAHTSTVPLDGTAPAALSRYRPRGGQEQVLLFPAGPEPIVVASDSGERCGVALELDVATPFGPALPSTAGDFDGDGLIDLGASGTCGFCESENRVYLGRR